MHLFFKVFHRKKSLGSKSYDYDGYYHHSPLFVFRIFPPGIASLVLSCARVHYIVMLDEFSPESFVEIFILKLVFFHKESFKIIKVYIASTFFNLIRLPVFIFYMYITVFQYLILKILRMHF